MVPLTRNCQTKRKGSMRPQRDDPLPKISRRKWYVPPLPGNAAPNSLHTSPSQMTSTAAITQAINACGPCIAARKPGIVMNGPIPTILAILSAIDCSNPNPRTSFVSGTDSPCVVDACSDGLLTDEGFPQVKREDRICRADTFRSQHLRMRIDAREVSCLLKAKRSDW